jgi:NAD+ synthase (glutamine-hydrolysing)
MKLRVALAQINPTVGDLAGNAALITKYTDEAVAASADVIVFPEMVLTGYPVEDLALRASFRSASKKALAQLVTALNPDIVSVVGYLDESSHGAPQNKVAIVYGSKVVATYTKRHLPNYGVFDEFRNFVPGDSTLVVRVKYRYRNLRRHLALTVRSCSQKAWSCSCSQWFAL